MENGMISPNKKKGESLGLTFHRSFSLNRPAILQILRLSMGIDNGGATKLKRKDIQEKSQLGTIYVEAMPRWAWGTGLISKDKKLSLFGKYALLYDSLLENSGTQWLMHYYLSAPHGAGPAFWNEIISNMLYPGKMFTSEELVEEIGNFTWRYENKLPAKRGVQSTATIFIGSYTKPEGLEKLRLFEKTSSGQFKVSAHTNPPVWAVGCALLDFWAAQFTERLGVGLDTLQQSGFLKLFLMSKSDFDEVLKNLQEAGYIDVYRTAPPYQVVLLRQDQDGLLKKLYGKN